MSQKLRFRDATQFGDCGVTKNVIKINKLRGVFERTDGTAMRATLPAKLLPQSSGEGAFQATRAQQVLAPFTINRTA